MVVLVLVVLIVAACAVGGLRLLGETLGSRGAAGVALIALAVSMVVLAVADALR